MILADQKLNQNDGYQIETIDDDLILMHPTDSQIIYTNQCGALIWQLCNGERTMNEIIHLLAGAYPDEVEMIQAQVPIVLADFIEVGVVR